MSHKEDRRKVYEETVKKCTDEELIEKIEWAFGVFDGVADRIVTGELFSRFKERVRGK